MKNFTRILLVLLCCSSQLNVNASTVDYSFNIDSQAEIDIKERVRIAMKRISEHILELQNRIETAESQVTFLERELEEGKEENGWMRSKHDELLKIISEDEGEIIELSNEKIELNELVEAERLEREKIEERLRILGDELVASRKESEEKGKVIDDMRKIIEGQNYRITILTPDARRGIDATIEEYTKLKVQRIHHGTRTKLKFKPLIIEVIAKPYYEGLRRLMSLSNEHNYGLNKDELYLRARLSKDVSYFTDYEGTSELKYLDDKYRRNNKTITETHPFKITQKESMEFRFFLIAQLLNNEEFSFSGNSGKKYTFSLKLEIIDENENSIYSFQEEFITLSFNKRSDRFIIIQNAKP